MSTHRPLALVAATAALGLSVAPPAGAAAKKFKNCTELNKKYPNGVGRPGARDKSSGEPVTTFRVNKAVYDANKGSDRDKDGVACEKA